MYLNISTKTRPIRLAYLVNPNNQKQTREAIQISSTLWGGQYFPIIQTYKRMPKTWHEKGFKTQSAESVILGYIEAFDPDILVQLSDDIPDFIKSMGIKIVKAQEIWKNLNENILSPKYGLGIFEILNDLFEKDFKFKMKYPLEIVLPKFQKQFSLFWASFFGEIPSNIMPIIREHYTEPLGIKEIDFENKDLSKMMNGNILFPRRIINHEIKNYNKSSFGRDACIYYLDATKNEDIVDFWNLRATGKTVLPMPKQFEKDTYFKKIIINFLKSNRHSWKHNPKVCDYSSIIRARNCSMDEIQKYVKTIKIKINPKDTSTDPYFSLQHWYPRIWNEWARDKDGATPSDVYGIDEATTEISDTQELKVAFKSLLPKFANKYSHNIEPRCANEVSFRFYGSREYIAEVFPKSFGENFLKIISGKMLFRNNWRVGRNGLVKLVNDDFNETRDLPLAEDVFFAWLEDLGWDVKLSSPGLWAKQIYKKLDGNISILNNSELLDLLEFMSGGANKIGKDEKIANEKYLPVHEIKNKLKKSSGSENLHDYLIKKGVFKMGLRIQCPHCSRNSWFSLESINETFTCPHCLNIFEAITNIKSSNWYYKTTGPFSVPNYADGSYSVLLTLDFFSEHKMNTIKTTLVLSFSAKSNTKEDIEADLAMFWQESFYGEKKNGVLFCECKTYNNFEQKDFDRMSYLAKTFPGAILVFSTLRKSITDEEKKKIKLIAQEGREYWKADIPINPVLILTGNELLNEFGPPYCWDDLTKQKFDNTHGIIDLCNATQQMYLGLIPWEEEWRKKWEKKYKKRKK